MPLEKNNSVLGQKGVILPKIPHGDWKLIMFRSLFKYYYNHQPPEQQTAHKSTLFLLIDQLTPGLAMCDANSFFYFRILFDFDLKKLILTIQLL